MENIQGGIEPKNLTPEKQIEEMLKTMREASRRIRKHGGPISAAVILENWTYIDHLSAETDRSK